MVAGGVAVEVFKVFSLDRVLHRLGEQIVEDGMGLGKVQQRFVEQNLEAWVRLRRSPT